jgi:hypothetical protein
VNKELGKEFEEEEVTSRRTITSFQARRICAVKRTNVGFVDRVATPYSHAPSIRRSPFSVFVKCPKALLSFQEAGCDAGGDASVVQREKARPSINFLEVCISFWVGFNAAM